jgi:predicted glycoside hydrolase/deacetylase ChbG (UPF0249 family)
MHTLVVTADDLGYSEERDRGIVRAYREGIVTGASLLVNAAGAARAVAWARAHAMPLGLHLNLTEGAPVAAAREVRTLLGGDGRFRGKHGLRAALDAGEADPAEAAAEAAAQVARFEALVGRAPAHVDSHQHTHCLPALREPLARALAARGVRSTRLACEAPASLARIADAERRAFYAQVSEDARAARAVYAAHGIAGPTCFLGLSLTDALADAAHRAESAAVALTRSIEEAVASEGATAAAAALTIELMVHPGLRTSDCRNDAYITGQPDAFSRSADRERELRMALDPEVRAAIAAAGCRLGAFSCARTPADAT